MRVQNRSNALRWVAFFLLVGMTLIACGQKKGVFVAGPAAGQPGVVNTLAPGESPVAIDPSTGETLPPGVTPTTGTTTAPTSGPVTPPPGGGDRTGITADEIILGLHAPETGAAPVQAEVFKAGVDLYWKWLHDTKGQKLFGRTVRVVTADDNYSPQTAVAVCNKMASQDKAFLLIGGAGTDQINACANFADQRGIPYLSPGVQEAGLSARRTYFAVTMTYRQQMAPLVQLLKKENKGSALNKYGTAAVKIGFVRPNTGNFDDADSALEQAATGAGFEYDVYSVVKEGNSTEAQTVANQLQQDGVDIVVPITAPTFTTQLAINTGKNNYKPLYAGIAITNNINQMINLVCRNNEFDRALFLSPWPGWKSLMADKYDKDFRTAANKYAAKFNHRDKGGDLLLALWGIMKTIHQAFLAAGPNVSRESFVATMNQFRYAPGAFPTIGYSAANHFGAQNVFVLQGSCAEPAGANGAEGGAQWITHPKYPNKYSSF